MERRALPLGDALWVGRWGGREVCLDFILERKTGDDLAASVIDGRYKEQKARLQRCGLAERFYLVEGDQTAGRVPKRCIETAARHTQVAGGLRLLRTGSLQESIGLLARMHRYLCAREWGDGEARQTYAEFERRAAKSSQLTLQQLFGRMLRVVGVWRVDPGVQREERGGSVRGVRDACGAGEGVRGMRGEGAAGEPGGGGEVRVEGRSRVGEGGGERGAGDGAGAAGVAPGRGAVAEGVRAGRAAVLGRVMN